MTVDLAAQMKLCGIRTSQSLHSTKPTQMESGHCCGELCRPWIWSFALTSCRATPAGKNLTCGCLATGTRSAVGIGASVSPCPFFLAPPLHCRPGKGCHQTMPNNLCWKFECACNYLHFREISDTELFKKAAIAL